LAAQERKKLRELDKRLKGLAPYIKKGEPKLADWARQLSYPPSR